MLLNFLLLFTGVFCGVMLTSCLVVASVEEDKEQAFQRGLEKGRLLGILEEKGRKHE